MIHKHHRKLRRHKDERPVNLIGLPDVIHQWVHDNPEKAREAGLIVPEHMDPEDVMVTIPEEALKKVRKPRAPEEKRSRTVISVRVPADARENGAEVFESLLEQCREKLDLASGGVSGAYIVLIAVMHDFITNHPKGEEDE